MGIEYKLFEKWSIGINRSTFEGGELKILSFNGIKNPILSAKHIRGEKVQYVADPFLVKKGDVYYLFFEVYKNNIGKIGYAISKNLKKWEYQNIVLDEPFHLSYPNIFKWEEKYYMLPECFETKSVRLYEAINFPYKWRFVKTLLKDKDFTDPTIICFYDKLWLFVSDTTSSNLYLYYSDSLKTDWQNHPKNPIIRNNRSSARPGGNIIQINNKLIRIAQDDSKTYGYAVRAFEITKLDMQEYEETELSESPLLKASGKGWNKDGMHHLSICPINDKEWLVSTDGKIIEKRYKFSIFLPRVLNGLLERLKF